jgi:hypothetical protein
VGARSFCEGVPLVDSEAARLSVLFGNVEDLETPSKCACNGPVSGTVDEFISGEDVVRYPMCEGCVDSGGGVSSGLLPQQFELEHR